MENTIKILRNSAMEVLVFNGIAAGTALAAVVLLSGEAIPYFGLVLLLMSVGLMLLGGALDLANSGSARQAARQVRTLFRARVPELEEEPTAEQRTKVGTTAATYAVTGVLLFAETGLLAYALF